MVIGEVAATTAPLEQSVVIGWVIGLLAILPLWDDWQYLETFLIVKTGMGGYYCSMSKRPGVFLNAL